MRRILFDAIQEIPIDRLAAQEAKITANTLSSWLQNDPDFYAEFQYFKRKGQSKLYERCLDKDSWKLMKATDHSTFRDQYDEESQQTHVVKIDPGDGTPDDFKGY